MAITRPAGLPLAVATTYAECQRTMCTQYNRIPVLDSFGCKIMLRAYFFLISDGERKIKVNENLSDSQTVGFFTYTFFI